MSNGSDIGEGILFGGPRKCNQELDCGREFCFHRQNLLGYFQNLEQYNDLEAFPHCHCAERSAGRRL